jgi:RNA polymerase sigma-70 factor (ECF subfamily)
MSSEESHEQADASRGTDVPGGLNLGDDPAPTAKIQVAGFPATPLLGDGSHLYRGASLLADDRHVFVADMAAKHGQRLRRFLAARLRNAADVADLAQEVFLRLLRVDRHDHIRSPEAYLFTIASHVLQQHTLNIATVPEPVDVMDPLVDERLAVESDPASQLHLERRLEALDRGLARLSVKTRAAFVLQRRDGCTLDEIGVRLGISRAMVKKHLAKAVSQCSRQIEDKG